MWANNFPQDSFHFDVFFSFSRCCYLIHFLSSASSFAFFQVVRWLNRAKSAYTFSLFHIRKMSGRWNIKLNKLQRRWKLKKMNLRDRSACAWAARVKEEEEEEEWMCVFLCRPFCGSCAIRDGLWLLFLPISMHISIFEDDDDDDDSDSTRKRDENERHNATTDMQQCVNNTQNAIYNIFLRAAHFNDCTRSNIMEID